MPRIHVHRYKDLIASGASKRSLAQAVADSALVRIRYGVYADGDAMRAGFPADRVVARATAAQLVTADPLVFSHETAAALHGLPLYRPSPDRVHVIARPERPGAVAGLVRHRGDIEEFDATDGLRFTSLLQTVADVARTASFEQGVVIADAALRRLCWDEGGSYRADDAQAVREQVLDIVRRSAHGQNRARRVVSFADGRAQLPGESVSRVRLHQLGFRAVGLQHAVPAPGGSSYFVDFALDEVNAFGEFDGAIKYVDGRMLDDRTSSEVLDREKQREDWIRGTTQRRMARWGWPHIGTADQLGARLRTFGIVPPGL
ncbi:hypothetical protein GCM10009775_18910 [Microbacterium aoyamense]|uniref:Transcriptional regulator, AbiEi antitoxin, Type IV TA system n=2 Tax=Microbacterium aoyamense TaxID=344166 RepID=A0ABP5AZN9_9MICO